MVLEVSVEREDTSDDRDLKRNSRRYELFTVYVEEQRILSIYAESDFQMKKWISDVQKSFLKKKNHPLVIGMFVDRDRDHRWGRQRSEDPYAHLILCIGHHCLVYCLPDYSYKNYHRNDPDSVPEIEPAPRVLQDFMADPNVIVVGLNMNEICEKLEKDHQLKIARSVDVWKLAYKVLGFRTVTKLSKTDDPIVAYTRSLVDKSMDVVKPKKIDMWTDPEDSNKRPYQGHTYDINRDYIKFRTVDAYFAHLIGVQYLDTINEIYPRKK
ncbi:exodeoxyribonuclease I [Ranunculus cassubicifolius]